MNPATCFGQSFGGLTNMIAGSNLLSIFPEGLYQVQAFCRKLEVNACLLANASISKKQQAHEFKILES